MKRLLLLCILLPQITLTQMPVRLLSTATRLLRLQKFSAKGHERTLTIFYVNYCKEFIRIIDERNRTLIKVTAAGHHETSQQFQQVIDNYGQAEKELAAIYEQNILDETSNVLDLLKKNYQKDLQKLKYQFREERDAIRDTKHYTEEVHDLYNKAEMQAIIELNQEYAKKRNQVEFLGTKYLLQKKEQ